eukprot:4886303-Amphidinium_carterae.1
MDVGELSVSTGLAAPFPRVACSQCLHVGSSVVTEERSCSSRLDVIVELLMLLLVKVDALHSGRPAACARTHAA